VKVGNVLETSKDDVIYNFKYKLAYERILVDPYVFGPPGSESGSDIILHGSGSFHQQAKNVRKTLIFTIL
jgi:hypothetical protein